MGLGLFAILLLVICVCLGLLVYCLAARHTRWSGPTSCRCGYDVESLTGSDYRSNNLDGSKTCPECGASLALKNVRVRGQVTTRYAPRTLSLLVITTAWLVCGVIAWMVIAAFAGPETLTKTSVRTVHNVGDTTATITWESRQQRTHYGGGIWQDGIYARVSVEGGRSFEVGWLPPERGGSRGWQRWLLRDDQGTETFIAEKDMPDALALWLHASTGLPKQRDNVTLVVVLREGAFGYLSGDEPGLYAIAAQPALLGRSTDRSYPWHVYAVGVLAAGLWVWGLVRSVRRIRRRHTMTVTYA